jgi:hypothetical protein
MAFDSLRDFVNALDKADSAVAYDGERNWTGCRAKIDATVNELKEERAMVADLLPK